MTAGDTLARVSRIVADTLDLDRLELQPDMTAADVDGWDSLSHVRIIVAIESEFGVRFSVGEIASLKSVGDLVERVDRKTGPRS